MSDRITVIETPRGPKLKLPLGTKPPVCVPCTIAKLKSAINRVPFMPPEPVPPDDGKAFFVGDKIDQLRAELRSWSGTPFVPLAVSKGGGVDCVRFAEQVYIALGACGPVNWPAYSTFGGGPGELEKMMRVLGTVPNLYTVWNKNLGELKKEIFRPGDMIVVSSGRAWHHLAIFDKWPSAVNCLTCGGMAPDGRSVRSGVQVSQVNEPGSWKRIYSVKRFNR